MKDEIRISMGDRSATADRKIHEIVGNTFWPLLLSYVQTEGLNPFLRIDSQAFTHDGFDF